MSVVIEAVLGFLLSIIAPGFAPKGRRTDRRLIAEDKVRSSYRAVEGRVLNIGTEWSTGTCEITPGHLRFIPNMGIVGDRQITVEGLRQIETGLSQLVAPWGESAHLIVDTGSGELHWAIPENTLDEVVERLTPRAR